MSDTADRVLITPDEAASLIPDGEYVHNFVQSSFALLGCDFSREKAVEAFNSAAEIEIGGSACQSMRHPIVVHEKGGRYSFFEADMDRFYSKYPKEKAGG